MQLIRGPLATNRKSPRKSDVSPLFSGKTHNGDSHNPRRAERKMRTLIAEDESAAREGLWELLKKENDIEIVGVSGSGQEALEAINQLQPDLIFLDAHIAESGGIELLKQVPCGSAPVIVFVATNEALAARAFDFQAADYLVKPYRQDRLHHALRRVREQFNQSHTNQLHTRIEALLADLREESRSAERIAVKSGRRILFLRPEEIV